jgi:hypothetical protein
MEVISCSMAMIIGFESSSKLKRQDLIVSYPNVTETMSVKAGGAIQSLCWYPFTSYQGIS